MAVQPENSYPKTYQEPVDYSKPSTGTLSKILPEGTFSDFLSKTPPGRESLVSGLWEAPRTDPFLKAQPRMLLPRISIYCDTEGTCEKEMYFDGLTGNQFEYSQTSVNVFLSYFCPNCRNATKVFAVKYICKDDGTGLVYKFGEVPAFIPKTPRRLLKIIQDDFELLNKGRRCEGQGLGIAAYAYYRRIVENNKEKLFGEYIKACEHLNAPNEVIETLKKASAEDQFTKSIESILNSIPASLKIEGQFPMSILYKVLSGNLHAGSDDDCLKLAAAVRTLLVDMCKKMSQALEDDAEIKKALSDLMKVTRERKESSNS